MTDTPFPRFMRSITSAPRDNSTGQFVPVATEKPAFSADDSTDEPPKEIAEKRDQTSSVTNLHTDHGGTIDNPDCETGLQELLASLVRQGMRERNWSARDLGKRTGYTAHYVWQMLAGARPGSIVAWDKLLNAVRPDAE